MRACTTLSETPGNANQVVFVRLSSICAVPCRRPVRFMRCRSHSKLVMSSWTLAAGCNFAGGCLILHGKQDRCTASSLLACVQQNPNQVVRHRCGHLLSGSALQVLGLPVLCSMGSNNCLCDFGCWFQEHDAPPCFSLPQRLSGFRNRRHNSTRPLQGRFSPQLHL